MRTLAVLAAGLSPSSRIMRKKTGQAVDTTTLLLALAVDRLAVLAWLQTEDARHGRNRPESLAGRLLRGAEAKKQADADYEVFDTPDAFLTARAIAIMKGGQRHGD